MRPNITVNIKKEIQCPYCYNEKSNEFILWNTSKEETIVGNRTITCPDCGMHIIVPFCSPEIYNTSQGIYVPIQPEDGSFNPV